MALRPSKKSRERPASARYKTASSDAPIEQAKKDISLVRALSEIVGEPSSAKAKLMKIESLIAVPILSASSKRDETCDNPGTDDNTVRGQLDKLGRVFKHIPDKSRNSVAATISVRQNRSTDNEFVFRDTVDIERGLERLLMAHGVNSSGIRDDLVRTVASLVRRASAGENIERTLDAIKNSERDSIPPLPKVAPRRYHQRKRSQNVIDFLREVYGPWVNYSGAFDAERCLTRVALHQLDPAAGNALKRWLQFNNHQLPADVRVPTKSQALDSILDSGFVPGPLVKRAASTVLRRARERRRNLTP
jgi:hypothetical protein